MVAGLNDARDVLAPYMPGMPGYGERVQACAQKRSRLIQASLHAGSSLLTREGGMSGQTLGVANTGPGASSSC